MGDQVYGLRCELIGHNDDVLGLCACDLGLVTSSADETAKIWVENDDGKSFSVSQTLVGRKVVGPITSIPSGVLPQHPNGAVVTGSVDGTVQIWDATTAASVRDLVGHSVQVTCVAVLPHGDIVSGSLDKTLKVWRGIKCILTLGKEFGSPVLSLLVSPSGDILSGWADGTVRRWCTRHWRCVQTYICHTDTVSPLLALLPYVGFVSGSNDFSLRIWAMNGQTLAKLYGHTDWVHSVAATDTGLLASGSDDNTVRLWRATGECLQIIEHPGRVWDVKFLPNHDLVTACSDTVARVWSPAPERQADAALTGLKPHGQAQAAVEHAAEQIIAEQEEVRQQQGVQQQQEACSEELALPKACAPGRASAGNADGGTAATDCESVPAAGCAAGSSQQQQQQQQRAAEPVTGAGAASSSGHKKGRPCAQCGKMFIKLKLCAGCGEVRYCGSNCQRLHWRAGHQATCSRRLLADAHTKDQQQAMV